MSVAEDVQTLNRELARRINQEARSNPQSPYANKLVGIAPDDVAPSADAEPYSSAGRFAYIRFFIAAQYVMKK